MFAFLHGILAQKKPGLVVIDCGGVGYELSIPLSTYEKLPAQGEQVFLQVLYQFNDTDGAKLYGFASKAEKNMFKLLLGVSKVGPRTAIAVLSTLSTEEFERSVLEGNLSLIATVPGIGRKSAQRLVLELKDKISGPSESTISLSSEHSSITEDALAALATLGFNQNEVTRCLARLNKTKKYKTAEELIKETIRELHTAK